VISPVTNDHNSEAPWRADNLGRGYVALLKLADPMLFRMAGGAQ